MSASSTHHQNQREIDDAEPRAEAKAAELNLVGAPAWMDDYAVWHRRHRNDPGARFLMYSCHDQENGQRTGDVDFRVCGGHGNRIKHICWTLRAAAASRLVLLVDWQWPENLEEYLGPVAVDWRPNAAERAILSDASSPPRVHKFNWPNVRTVPPPEEDKYVRVTGGSSNSAECYNCTGFQAGHLSRSPIALPTCLPDLRDPEGRSVAPALQLLRAWQQPQAPGAPTPAPAPTPASTSAPTPTSTPTPARTLQASFNSLYRFLFRPTAAFRQQVLCAPGQPRSLTTHPHTASIHSLTIWPHTASPHSLTIHPRTASIHSLTPQPHTIASHHSLAP